MKDSGIEKEMCVCRVVVVRIVVLVRVILEGLFEEVVLELSVYKELVVI